MKKYIKIYVILALVLQTSLSWGQTTRANHLVIADNFRFYYFDTPGTSTPYLISNSDVRNGTESDVSNGTASVAFWSNTGMAEFHRFLRALLKAPSNGGDQVLQHYAAKLVNINSKKIKVRLWNDTTPFNSSDVAVSNRPCQDDSNYAWPCASHWSNNQYWGGYMHLGIHHAVDKGLKWLKETFLHELMHTQDATNQLGNSYVVFQRSYRYGHDQAHRFFYSPTSAGDTIYVYSEAIPNKRLAYMEAIADVAPMYYDFNKFQKWFDWFVNNRQIIIERNAPSNWVRMLGQLFGAGYNDNVWLYDEIRNYPGGTAGTTVTGATNYSKFNIQSLPGKFIVHNEHILAMIMTMTSMHVAEIDPFVWTTGVFNTRISTNQNQDPLALFTKIFSEGMLQNGETINAIKQELDARNYTAASVNTPYTFVLPLAYSDYFTAYSATTKNEFKALFNNEMDTDLIDIYWDHFKDRVRNSVPINSTRTWSDMTSIAQECGVNQSYLPGTSGRRYEGN